MQGERELQIMFVFSLCFTILSYEQVKYMVLLVCAHLPIYVICTYDIVVWFIHECKVVFRVYDIQCTWVVYSHNRHSFLSD